MCDLRKLDKDIQQMKMALIHKKVPSSGRFSTWSLKEIASEYPDFITYRMALSSGTTSRYR